VTFLQRQFDGTLAPYPSDQMFNVWMNTDESYGTLQSGWGVQGSWLIGPQPFTFIAADSIAADSAIVQIEAEASSGGVSTAIRNGAKDELQKQQKLSVSKLMKILSGGNKTDGMNAEPMGKSALKEKATASMQTHISSTLLKKLHPPRKLMAEGEGCVPTGTVLIIRTTENRPPIITKVTFDPPRRYFQLGSSVTVTATAIDPDGDQVSITYQPGHAFTVNNLGTLVVTTVAKDSKGESAERKDTVFGVFVYIANDTPPRVKDGESAGFHVGWLPADLSSRSIEWTRIPVDPNGGNNPQRDFQPPETKKILSIPITKWYATPNLQSGAKAECEYETKAEVAFADDVLEATAKLVVWLPLRSGEVTRANVEGNPDAVPILDPKGNPHSYEIRYEGTLTRTVGEPVIHLPISSQFHEKALKHERVHVQQWQTGMWSDLYLVSTLLKRLRGM